MKALRYHARRPAGKTQIAATKPCDSAADLALAYTPGVATPCRAIERHPDSVYRYTNKGNLVAIVSNGTAVLGLGNLGPLAAKPVMEGKALLYGAALLNGLEIQGKAIDKVRVVIAGAGAAGIACAAMLSALGVGKERIVLVDSQAVVHTERIDLNKYKRRFATRSAVRTLADALRGADVFVGVSGPGTVTAAMLGSMAERPLIFALANPEPEVSYEVVDRVRPDAIFASGRSDYPNQVNNVLAFPSIFRGALDVRATRDGAHCASGEPAA